MIAKRFIPIVIVAAIVVGFLGGFYYRGSAPAQVISNVINKDAGQPKDVDFAMFWNVWNLLHEKFVDKNKLNAQDLIYGAIDGMVKAAGDPYTVFFKPKESEEFQQQIGGAFGGIGIEVGLRNNVLTVIAPIKDTPAAAAGMLAGDKIIKIGSKSTSDMKIDEAVGLIRGQIGTNVTLTISREGLSSPKEITMTRSTIKIPAVDWKMLDDHTAYLQIFIFSKNVDEEFQKAADEIGKSKADRIIIDLRNNPGGLLDSAVNISGYLMDADKVVTIEKSGDGTQNEFKTQENGKLKKYPLVVLINKGSASASEILSGALRDNRGVLLIGETSFGKGSVQEVVDLPQKASFKVTIAKWFTPKGLSINENGIKPDIEVKFTEDDVKNNKDSQLDKAREIIKNLK